MKEFKMKQAKYREKSKMYYGASSLGKGAIRIVPLGGVGGVTKNMYIYEYRYNGKIQDILIVDCGIGFPDSDMFGVDLTLPDVRYLLDKQKYIRALVFTHAHDDHIGGIPYIIPKLGSFPMYGTRLTAAFTNIKLGELRSHAKVQPVSFGDVIEHGSFRIAFIRVTHSVPDSAHLVIETPVGIFYHGSDFKFDRYPLDGKTSEFDKINAVGKRGVLCLFTDSLGSERAGFSPSEKVIGDTLTRELSFCHGRLLFTTISSNISRIQLAVNRALAFGRKIAFVGMSVEKNVREGIRLGYMTIPKDAIIQNKQLRKLPPIKQFLIVAGSQGQHDSALVKIANDVHKYIHIGEGDTVVFSSDPIPGNEVNVYHLIDQLFKTGARVSYSGITEDLHVSGHGSQGDLMLLLSTVGPKYVFPTGGTYRHIMQYQKLACELGHKKNDVLIPEEGEIIEFRINTQPKTVEKIELENIMIDGFRVGDIGSVVLRDRRTIAKEGIVVVVVPVSSSLGKVISEPDIISRGFVYMKNSTHLVEKAKKIVTDSLHLKKGKLVNWYIAREQVEHRLGQFLYKQTGRHPLIVPVIINV